VNGTTLEQPDVAAYLDAVRSRLSDLPAEERDDLVADVEASLLESGEPPTLSPDEFAAELREAAGLAAGERAAGPRSMRESVRAWLASSRVAALRATARELAPIWWVARAYVAVVVAALALGQEWPLRTQAPVGTSILAVVAASALSVWIGVRARRTRFAYPRARAAVEIALAVALVPVLAYSLDRLTYRSLAPYTAPEPTPGLAYDGLQIRNVYPYSREGELLLDVFLYDENGRPLDVLSASEDTTRRVLAAVDGARLFNSFPIRYFEPGTAKVAQPKLGPPVEVPAILTPALERPPR
jgi:uncharacterized membrane protein